MGRRLHRIVFLCTLELLICVIFRLKAEAIGSSFRACNFVTRVLPKECCLAQGEIWEREGIDGEEHFILSVYPFLFPYFVSRSKTFFNMHRQQAHIAPFSSFSLK